MSLRNEQQVVRAMISLYCKLHHQSNRLCEQCSELLEYAEGRLGTCPFGDDKPTCQGCHVHCYAPEMRKRVAQVMRFSGPRMIFHHPIMALRHLLHTKRSDTSAGGDSDS